MTGRVRLGWVIKDAAAHIIEAITDGDEVQASILIRELMPQERALLGIAMKMGHDMCTRIAASEKEGR